MKRRNVCCPIAGCGRCASLGEQTALAATQRGASAEGVCDAALKALAENRADIPFAAIYTLNPGDPAAHLVSSMGMTDPSVFSAAVYGSTSGLVLRDIVNTGASTVLDALPPSWGAAMETGANPVGDQPPTTALILPIQAGGADLPATVMVAGVTPYRSLDDDYRGFLDLATAQINRAIGGAQEYEQTRCRRAHAAARDPRPDPVATRVRCPVHPGRRASRGRRRLV